MESLSPELLEDLFRFAFVLTGDRRAASQITGEVAAEVEVRSAQWRVEHYRLIWAARLVCDLWRRGPEGGESKGARSGVLAEACAGLPRRELSVLALLLWDRFNAAEMGQILRLRARDLQVGMLHARERMETVEGGEVALRGEVLALVLSEEERANMEGAAKAAPQKRRPERTLGVLSVLLGAFALVVWFGLDRWRQTPPIAVARELDQLWEAHIAAGPDSMEVLQGGTAELADWLFLNGFDSVRIPEPLKGVRIGAVRSLRWRDGRVAELAVSFPPAVVLVTDARGVSEKVDSAPYGRVHFEGWRGAWVVSGSQLILFAAPAGDPQTERFSNALLEWGKAEAPAAAPNP